MPSLIPNLVKRVERLPKPIRTSDAMQPLFEAISNSIHSVQTMFGDKVNEKAHIDILIDIKRDKQGVKIVVQDNGVGLDRQNYDAFLTTDTDNKLRAGGKGIGRLLWLDCFQRIQVQSTYRDNGRARFRRFDFRLSMKDQIHDLREGIADKNAHTGVIITFEGLRDNGYLEKFPGRPSYIFQHLTSHFLPIFIGQRSPKITVSCGDERRDFPTAINELIHRRQDVSDFPTNSYGRMMLIMMECDKVASADLIGTHFIHFIGHDRTVRSQKIDAKLGLKGFGQDGNHVFHACLFGEYLDQKVNQERTGFAFGDDIVEDIVNTVCMPHVESFLHEPLAALKKAQSTVVNQIVETYPSVAFGPVEELQSHIPIGELNEDAIYAHLSRQRFRRDKKQGEKIKDVLSRLKARVVDENLLASTIAEATKAIEEAEQKSLAEYIVRRKVILDFLEILIQKVKDDTSSTSYQREDILHSFICPMKVNTLSSNKKVEVASHDLWVIDERLTFAQYFSSDAPFTELAATYNSEERPDLLVFDRVHGLRATESASRVLLVEFKRPGRKHYEDNENPQLQVERYIKRLLEGGELDVKGRPIRLNEKSVFYCFIIADCVGRMDEWTYSWSRTADGRGRLYQARNGFNGSIELIEWDALLRDARERNVAFFDRAGISGKSIFSDS